MTASNLSQAHQLLLSAFRKPREVPSGGFLASHSLEEWRAALRQPVPAAISSLLSQGLLSRAALHESLASLTKVPDLRDALRERGLPVSGPKLDLATRLAQADPPLAASLTKGRIVYKSTEAGEALISAFLQEMQEHRATTDKSLIHLLGSGEFRKAIEAMASFEAAQVFSRGMGVDWAHYDPEHDEAILRLIFSRLPKATVHAPPEDLPNCRIGAAMLHLTWNVGQVSTWLSEVIPGKDEETLFKIASDLRSHALFLSELESVKSLSDSGIRMTINVLTCNDDLVCASCRSLEATKYDPEDAPELPNPECSNPPCRCSIGAAVS
jgi:hypothetical protein